MGIRGRGPARGKIVVGPRGGSGTSKASTLETWISISNCLGCGAALQSPVCDYCGRHAIIRDPRDPRLNAELRRIEV